MSTMMELSARKAEILRNLSPKAQRETMRQWEKVAQAAQDAFTMQPAPDVATLREIYNARKYSPTFAPTIERMLAHPACK